MKKQINLNGREVDYTIKISKRIRGIKLSVYADKGFVVTIPKNTNYHLVSNWIIKNSSWIIDKLDYFKQFQNQFSERMNGGSFVDHKERALTLIINRLQFFNNYYKFIINRVAVRNQKTRWGSCSGKGNLNFNYRIVFLSQKLADYIVVHELCHLGEFNHSQKFWDLVIRTVPDYLDIRMELRRVGFSLL